MRMIGGAKLLSSGQVAKERKKDLLEGVPGGGRAPLLMVRPHFLDSGTSDKLRTMPLT